MRKILIASAGLLLMAAPAFAQISTETTTTKRTTTEDMVPPPAVIVTPAAPGYKSETTVTHSGDAGMSRTDKKTESYVGVDGTVHKDQMISA